MEHNQPQYLIGSIKMTKEPHNLREHLNSSAMGR